MVVSPSVVEEVRGCYMWVVVGGSSYEEGPYGGSGTRLIV